MKAVRFSKVLVTFCLYTYVGRSGAHLVTNTAKKNWLSTLGLIKYSEGEEKMKF